MLPDLCVLNLLPMETPCKKPGYAPVHDLLILLSAYAMLPDLCVLNLLPMETPCKKPGYAPVHDLLILLSA